eukprot:m.100259 g.100259  ORF g.100259 m.100259 type:complete len:61 (+) comp13163_c1_seq5:40-222(+)
MLVNIRFTANAVDQLVVRDWHGTVHSGKTGEFDRRVENLNVTVEQAHQAVTGWYRTRKER